MAKTYEEYLEEAKKTTAAEESAAIKVVDDSALAAKTATQEYYDKQIGNTNTAYESEYQKNAVQKLINEKQIAEKTANLGLTDSGLNRTQQTAAQLSYANQKGKIDLAKQSALDELSLSLSSALSNIEQEAQANKSSIKQTYAQQNAATAAELYNTDVENEYNTYLAQLEASTELQKAQIEASAKDDENSMLLYNWKGETVLDDNGNELIKFIGNDGKTYNVTPGKNPYTNNINAKISNIVDGKCIIDADWQKKNENSSNAITRSCAKYGVFSNGYQPKGVCYYDEKGNVVDEGELTATLRKDYMNGKLQTVWETKDTGRYWIWNGSTNEYELYSEQGA